jgi:hypothetical protein
MSSAPQFPKSLGLLLYPQFEVLDVAGPIETLNCLARSDGFGDMKLSIISRTLGPVSIGPNDRHEKGSGCLGVQLYQPTHTFDTAPQLDVLLVPGSAGSIVPPPKGYNVDIDDYIQFVRSACQGFGDRKPTLSTSIMGQLFSQKLEFWMAKTQPRTKTSGLAVLHSVLRRSGSLELVRLPVATYGRLLGSVRVLMAYWPGCRLCCPRSL